MQQSLVIDQPQTASDPHPRLSADLKRFGRLFADPRFMALERFCASIADDTKLVRELMPEERHAVEAALHYLQIALKNDDLRKGDAS